MDNFKITDTSLNKNLRFRSFFSTIARWQTNNDEPENANCSFTVSCHSERLGQFEFDYKKTSDEKVTLVELRIHRYDGGISTKLATYNFITKQLAINCKDTFLADQRYLKSLKKLIDWFCSEYEMNALGQTEFSFFANNR